jgi:hypothetical protein
MPDGADTRPSEKAAQRLSRRTFIKGVITSGVAVSSANVNEGSEAFRSSGKILFQSEGAEVYFRK